LDQIRGALTLDDLVATHRAVGARDREFDALHHEVQRQRKRLAEHSKTLQDRNADLATKRAELCRLGEKRASAANQMAEHKTKLTSLTGGAGAAAVLQTVKAHLIAIQEAELAAEKSLHDAQARRTLSQQQLAAADEAMKACTAQREKADRKLAQGLAEAKFADVNHASAVLRTQDEQARLRREIDAFRLEEQQLASERKNLELKIRHRRIAAEDWQQCQTRRAEAEATLQSALAGRGAAAQALEDTQRKHTRWQQLVADRARLAPQAKNLEILQALFRGNEFVEFLASEQLRHIAWVASEQLGQLTRYRYALEVDSESGFVIRDDHNGGSKRPTCTLSGGETFLASLALALALSKQIQLGNRYPLEFFFLDEGFGSLDTEVLETVITALERLNLQNMTVGIISRVPELRNRIPRRLLVEPAEPGGRGTRVQIEKT
jgi:exonuclease SbcC